MMVVSEFIKKLRAMPKDTSALEMNGVYAFTRAAAFYL
jgi:hypothetical protein